MRLRLGCVALCLFVESTGFAIEVALIDAGEISSSEVVESEQSLITILESTQVFFQQICPPMPQMYVDRKSVPYPVDWLGFSKKTTKYLTAEMDQYGLPRYRLLIYEDVVTRDRVITLASTGFEVARIPAPKEYQPELYYQSLLLKGAVYSEAMRWIFDPAHTATEVILYPESLYSSYVEYEADRVAQEESLVPMAMSATSGPPVPGGSTNTTGSITVTNNTQVTLILSLAENFGAYVEIYGRETLVWESWDLMDGWVPTYGVDSLEWMDAASSNKNTFFYQFFDATIDSDGDGYSDSREAWSGTDSNVFDLVNTDNDDLHDWWELKLFGNLNQVGSGDFDSDGLLNNEELTGAVDGISTMYTDPSLFDTDGDGLGDGYELLGSPPTDPLNDDATAPVVTISSPAPETVFVP